MSDFGFDAYALGDVDTAGQPHPLEIARDLIAAGKPRSALEVLSLHHAQLADDPEYLLLCSEAWRADGDTLRAQQALMGANRLAPDDPRPLQWLSELLADRGEHDKAERLLAKARGLEVLAIRAEEPLDAMGPESEDDLIAFAERQERSSRAALTPRQVLLGAVALAGIALLIGGIALITSSRKAAAPARDPAPTAAAAHVEEAAPSVLAEELAPIPAIEIDEVEPLGEPFPEPPRKTATAPRGSAPAAEALPPPVSAPPPVTKAPRKAATALSRKAASPPPAEEPDAAVVQAELASMDSKQLTSRADALDVEGHMGLAASYYRRALELDPDYAPALVGIGQSILRAKKYSEAMSNATRALQLARGVDARPGLEAAAIYQVGRVHYERGERDSARRLFRQSISLPGTPPEAWFYLGEALSSDNSRAAREAYEKYLELVSEGHLADRAHRAIQ